MTPQERFWPKVAKTETCWLWTGAVTGGYGRFRLQGKSQRAHRLAYEWEVGTVPDGLVLDHLCRVRHCVNPEHLEPVTAAENTRRGDFSQRPRPALRATCLRGHGFTPENTYLNGGVRYCRTCHMLRERDRRARLAAAA